MYKNYFFLNRLTIELNSLLRGFTLFEAFSQEKEKLVLHFQSNDEHCYLLISTSQNLPFLQIRNDYNRAKKNTMDFFPGYFPAILQDVNIAAGDRIIRFGFSNFSIYFFIRGKDTNVCLIDNDRNLLTYKKISTDSQSLIDNLIQKQYSGNFSIPEFKELTAFISIDAVRNSYPNLGKEIIKELKTRTNSESPEEIIDNLKNILKEIRDNKFSVFYDNQLNRFVLTVNSFKSFSPESISEFDDYREAFNFFLTQKYKYERIINYKKMISGNLDHQLTRISGKLNEIRHKINEPSKEEVYKYYGNLLLTYMHLIKKGMKEIEVTDFTDENKKINIKLEETLDSKGNVDKYFEKARNERQSRLVLSDLFSSLENKYHDLQKTKNKLDTAKTLEDYIDIMDKMNIKPEQNQSSKKEDEFNFKHYIIENKYHVYVGKDSRNNDELTTRFAKQNDYWFHARGVPGSHAVLRIENSKEPAPKPVLKKAASIAAYHSKAKTSKLAPVAYALKKYVVKRKGMEPGKVALLKEEVLLVKPEIPEGCEYVTG